MHTQRYSEHKYGRALMMLNELLFCLVRQGFQQGSIKEVRVSKELEILILTDKECGSESIPEDNFKATCSGCEFTVEIRGTKSGWRYEKGSGIKLLSFS